MVVPVPLTDPITQLHLPPGFRFNPTDVELIVHYLFRKITGQVFPLQIIGDVDLYKFNPWELPSKATFGDKEWYFFSPRDRKYPNGFRPNRVAGSGYWKATGTDKVITSDRGKVGVKKALVFYVGKAPKGSKTNWIMHEYRLSEPTTKNNSTRLDDWVLCRIYKKNSTAEKTISGGSPSSSNVDNVTTNNSMFKQDGRVAKFNSGGYEWMSVGVFGLHDPITDNDRVNSTFVDRAFEMQMGFGESPDGEVNAGIRSQRVGSFGCMFSQSCTSRTDPFAIRYPTRQGGSGYGEESE